MANVPSTQEFIDSAKTYSTITGFLGAMAGAIVIAIQYVISNPLRAIAVGLGYILSETLRAIGNMLSALPGGVGDVVKKGFNATATAVQNEGIAGAIMAIFLVWATWYLFQLGQNVTDSDAPFLGDIIPFWGGNSEE